MKPQGILPVYEDTIGTMVTRLYNKTMLKQTNEVKLFFVRLYGFIPKFEKKETSTIWIKIKSTMDNILKIKEEIQNYLGYRAHFYKFVNEVKTTIDLDKIMEAHSMVKNRVNFIKIENLLYM